MVIAIGLTLTGARSVAQPLGELTAAMRRARADGRGGKTDLLTDDEVGALAASYASMLERLRTQHDALERGVARLREVDTVRTRFLNIASHELRTPMTPLRTELHLLRAGKRGPVTPEMDRSLAMLSRNADRLHRLIKEMLEASRMQAGQLRLQRAPLPLEELVAGAVRTMEGEAEARGVALEMDAEPARVLADADRLSQVLINLIENAIQFTPRGGRVRVEARARAREAEVRVVDTGVGIDAEALPKLFQPFSQAETGVPRTEGGTGLGLYICKGIVEGHGGTITCSSAGRGMGATFAFTVPLAETAPTNEDLAPATADRAPALQAGQAAPAEAGP
jgi:signal transduction histidine kinase